MRDWADAELAGCPNGSLDARGDARDGQQAERLVVAFADDEAQDLFVFGLVDDPVVGAATRGYRGRPGDRAAKERNCDGCKREGSDARHAILVELGLIIPELTGWGTCASFIPRLSVVGYCVFLSGFRSRQGCRRVARGLPWRYLCMRHNRRGLLGLQVWTILVVVVVCVRAPVLSASRPAG